MIASDDLGVAAAPPVVRRETAPNYLGALAVGLLVAIICMPIHRLAVSGTYANGTYRDWPILSVIPGIAVGLTVRGLGRGKHNITLALMASALTVISVLGSEYLLMQYLVHEYGIEEGLGNLPLLLAPGDMISLTFDGFINEPMDAIFALVAIGAAFYIAYAENLGRRGWSATDAARYNAAMPSRPLPSSPAEVAPVVIQAAPISLDPKDIPTEALSMGSPLRTYNTGMPSLVGPVIFCVIGLVVAALTLLVPDATARIIFLVIFAGIPLLIGIGKLIGALMATDDKVLIFQKGVAITQKDKTATIQWNEIDKLFEHQYKHYYNGIKVQDVHNFTLQLGDGRKFVLGKRFKQIVEIGDILHVKVSELKLPAAVEAFKRGETVDFQGVRLNRDGIQIGKSVVPWPQVKDVRVTNGAVQVQEHGKSNLFGKTVMVAQVANVRVFLILIEKIMENIHRKAGG